MNIATIAMALAVLQDGSIRGAARLVGRPPSTVADAFERFQSKLALTLGQRSEGAFSLTVAGQALAGSAPPLLAAVSALAAIGGAVPDAVLPWAASKAVTIASLVDFAAVVEAGSIRRAARALDLAQPHLSRRMSALARALGCRLLRRTEAGCEPTIEGEKLKAAAAVLVGQMAALTAPADARFARTARTVKLGTVIPIGHESRLASRLAALVSGWRRERPGQDLLVASTTAEDLIAGLRSGRFDVALMDMALDDKRFQSREMFSSELVLVGAKELPLRQEALAALLSAHPIAVPSLRSGLRQKIRELLDPLLQDNAVIAQNLVEVDALSIVINLITEHGFLSVLPLDAVHSLESAVGMVAWPGAPRVPFHLVWPRTVAARALARKIEVFLALQS